MRFTPLAAVMIACGLLQGCSSIETSIAPGAANVAFLGRDHCSTLMWVGIANNCHQAGRIEQFVIQNSEGGTIILQQPASPTESSRTVSNVFLVQIGAFSSAEDAQAAFRRIRLQFKELIGTRRQQIETTNRDGRDYYRLRLAPAEANRGQLDSLCSALKERGQNCAVVSALD